MSLFGTTKRWLAPLPILLLAGSVAMASNDPEAASSFEQTHATQVTSSGATLQADDQGVLSLRIDQSLIDSPPETLYKSLLELVHNNDTYSQRPAQVDANGEVHYLVRLGQKEAGTELQLKPVSTSTSIDEIASMLATSFTTLITLKAADHVHGRQFEAGSLPFGAINTDGLLRDYLRNHARQTILISSLQNGDAIHKSTTSLTGEPADGRTRWQDTLPALAAAGVTAGVSYSLHDTNNAWYEKLDLSDNVGMYHMSATTNALGLALRKANEALINDLTEVDPRTTQHIARAASVVESITALTLANATLGVHPAANNGQDWNKSLLGNSMAITMIYTVRDLVAELSEDLTGSSTLGELIAASGMTAASSLLHVNSYHPLSISNMTYASTTAFLTAEAAGASLSYALQKQINQSLTGVDPYKVRAARLGSAAILSLTMKSVARQLAGHGWETTANILSPMADGVIISNVMDALGAVKDSVIEPWVVKPLLNWANPERTEKKPAIRLRSSVLRRPLLDTSI